jgi:ergothioneine biosynthesis protein EgtB
MHVETLSYLLHRLPYEAKEANREPAGGTRAGMAGGIVAGMVEIPAGAVTLGMRRGEAFGWDNEFEASRVAVAGFRMDRFKVTNGEYAEFVADGGYKERRWWTAEAWDWKRAEGIRLPAFWRREGEEYVWRGMFAEVDLPLDGPVYVSQAEASAYALWKGKRLPTEAEWQRAAYGSENGERAFPWGDAEPAAPHGIGGEIGFAPWAVDAHPAGQSAWGVWGLMGNGWEWTQTVFGPLPGFATYPFYPGYSADFFDGKHFVLKGGSRATKPGLLRRSFRNWFQPHYQYTYSGFRCAETI